MSTFRSLFSLRSALVLIFAIGAAAVWIGCDNSVEQMIPDAEATPEGWSLVWSDEFDGTEVDTTKWEFQLGDGCEEDICGWGNGEFQNYRAENATVEDGRLIITARQNIVGNDTLYTSARLRTLGRGDWTYGRFEVKAKLPTGQGLWPAIWLLFSEPTYGEWAASGEIDIMESIGSEPGEVFGTLHYGNTSPGNVFSGEEFQLVSETFNEDFYVFIVEWEEGEIRWYINNVLFQTQTSDDWFTGGANGDDEDAEDYNPNAPFDHDFHMILNVAVGGNLPGAPDVSTFFPQAMEVDYVRVYERTAE